MVTRRFTEGFFCCSLAGRGRFGASFSPSRAHFRAHHIRALGHPWSAQSRPAPQPAPKKNSCRALQTPRRRRDQRGDRGECGAARIVRPTNPHRGPKVESSPSYGNRAPSFYGCEGWIHRILHGGRNPLDRPVSRVLDETRKILRLCRVVTTGFRSAGW